MLSYVLVFLNVGIITELLGFAGITWVAAEISWGFLVIGMLLFAINHVSGDRPLLSNSSPPSQTTDDLERSFPRQARAAFPPESRFSIVSGNNSRNRAQDFTTGLSRTGTRLAIGIGVRASPAAARRRLTSFRPRGSLSPAGWNCSFAIRFP